MTVITSENYWKVVFGELQEDVERNGESKYLLISKRYDEAIKIIEDRIMAWYGRHAIGNKVSLRNAYKKLPKDQLEIFQVMINEYLKYWTTELGYDKDEIEPIQKVSEKDTSESDVSESDTLSDAETWLETLILYQSKQDVTQYESLVIPIINEIEKVSHETSLALLALVGLTGWTIYDSITKNLKLKPISQDALKKELLKSWAADEMTLYDRLSANKSKLSSSVKAMLVKGFKNEMTVDAVISEVAKTMGIGQNAARRLVVTENTHFSTYATYLAMKQAGYTQYQYFSRLTANTCEDCMALHGSVFPIEAFEEGVTAPSLHPYCVCYVKPVLGSEVTK